MTDDLDMAAIAPITLWRRLLYRAPGSFAPTIARRETVVRAIAAGNDLLMIRNVSGYDELLPQKVVKWVKEAIDEGVLSERRIAESAERVRRLKRRISDASSAD